MAQEIVPLTKRLSDLSQGIGASGLWGIDISGSAAKLAVGRNINHVLFDGTQDISITSLVSDQGLPGLQIVDVEEGSGALQLSSYSGVGVIVSAKKDSLQFESDVDLSLIAARDLTLHAGKSLSFKVGENCFYIDFPIQTAIRKLSLPDADVSIPKGTLITAENDSVFSGSRTFKNPIIVNGVFNHNGTQKNSQNLGFYPAPLETSGDTQNPENTVAIVAKLSSDKCVALTVDAQGYFWGYCNNGTKDKSVFSSKAKVADKLTEKRNIALKGVVSGSGDFDGSSSIEISTQLANTGVAEGWYNTSGASITPLRFGKDGRLLESGIPVLLSLLWENVRNKPTTLEAYGITNAVARQTDNELSGKIHFTNKTDAQSLSQASVVLDGGLAINKSLRVGGTTTFLGTVLFQGSVFQLDATKTILVEDPVITVGGASAAVLDDMFDRGVEFNWHNGIGPLIGFMGLSRKTNNFVLISKAVRDKGTYSGPVATLEANVLGDLQGNAQTASALKTPVNITLTGSVQGQAKFNGRDEMVMTVAFSDESLAVIEDLKTQLQQAQQSNNLLKQEIDDIKNHLGLS